MNSDLYRKLDQSQTYQDALLRVQHRLDTGHSRYIIGIAGLPGSGKSTLGDYIALRLNQTHPNQVISVSMDGFHLSKAQLSTFPDVEAAFARRGAPWTFDSQRFYQHLVDFKQPDQKPLTWPSFDHTQGDPVEGSIIIPSEARILIVEGLYVLHNQHGFEHVQKLLDEKWFIDLPIEAAMKQLAKRHQQAWGISLDEAQQRIASNDALNAQIVEQTKNRADYFLSVK